MKTVKLSSGREMPLVGFGMYKLEKDACQGIIHKALSVGYRHFDGAAIYQNEAAVGQALKSGPVPRPLLFLTSKLWCTMQHPSLVPKAAEQTLRDLQTDYLDLYLIHWPLPFDANADMSTKYDSEGRGVLRTDVTLVDTWRAMEALVDQGKVRSIGVSNFTIPKLQLILDHCRIPPAVNQVECHPYLQQDRLLRFCREKNIHVTAYAPLGSQQEPKVLEDPVVVELAEKHGITAAQLCLKWALQRDCVVIPKTSQVERVEENWKSHQVPDLSPEEMGKMASLERKHRFFDPMEWWKVDCFDDDSY